jgi:hypothetical protein
MVKFLIKGFALLSGLTFFISCAHTNNKPLIIDFSRDRSYIEIKNINPSGLLELKKSNVKDSALNRVVYVLQTPSEKDSLIEELSIAGQRRITDSSIVFVPAVPFVKNRDYVVTTFLNTDFADVAKMLKGKLSYGVKPHLQTLTR